MKRCLLPLLLAVLLLSGCSAPDSYAPTAAALADAGLQGHPSSYRPLHADSHGGFHGDGCTRTVFEVDTVDHRDALWDDITQRSGWTVASVNLADYDRMIVHCNCCPEFYPRPGTVFDAWYFRDDQPSEYSRNESIAFYDKETGLFVFYRIDT